MTSNAIDPHTPEKDSTLTPPCWNNHPPSMWRNTQSTGHTGNAEECIQIHRLSHAENWLRPHPNGTPDREELSCWAEFIRQLHFPESFVLPSLTCEWGSVNCFFSWLQCTLNGDSKSWCPSPFSCINVVHIIRFCDLISWQTLSSLAGLHLYFHFAVFPYVWSNPTKNSCFIFNKACQQVYVYVCDWWIMVWLFLCGYRIRWVCVTERERERVPKHVCVCVRACVHVYMHEYELKMQRPKVCMFKRDEEFYYKNLMKRTHKPTKIWDWVNTSRIPPRCTEENILQCVTFLSRGTWDSGNNSHA